MLPKLLELYAAAVVGFAIGWIGCALLTGRRGPRRLADGTPVRVLWMKNDAQLVHWDNASRRFLRGDAIPEPESKVLH